MGSTSWNMIRLIGRSTAIKPQMLLILDLVGKI